jgi:hypothetical protein
MSSLDVSREIKEIEPYHLRAPYEVLIDMVRRSGTPKATEVWGMVKFEGVSDFRLNFGKYRIVE